MGTYTEWYIRGVLSPNTPETIVNDIKRVVEHDFPIGVELSRCVGNNYQGGFYWIGFLRANDKENFLKHGAFFICGSFKNYERDIGKFLEYISPYVVNGYGEILYEECPKSQKFVIFNGSLKYGEYHPPIY